MAYGFDSRRRYKERSDFSDLFLCAPTGTEPVCSGPLFLVCSANGGPPGHLVRILTSPQYACTCVTLRQSVPHPPALERILVTIRAGHMLILKVCPAPIGPESIPGADKRGTLWREKTIRDGTVWHANRFYSLTDLACKTEPSLFVYWWSFQRSLVLASR